MDLETKITATFSIENPTPEEVETLAALNLHAEDCAERLQFALRSLVIQMMDIKHKVGKDA